MSVSVLNRLASVIKIIYILGIALLLFFSIKELFGKEKGRIKLFLYSFFTSPFMIMIEAEALVTVIGGCLWSRRTGTFDLTDEFIRANTDVLALHSVLFGIVFLCLNLLFAWLCGKWLKISEKQQVIFLYLMFSTFALFGLKGVGGATEMFNIEGMQFIVDIIGTTVLFFSAYLFYRYDILTLSQNVNKNIRVNWRLFSIPPACFSFLYVILFILMVYDDSFSEDTAILLTYVFSATISYLLVWAFYIISQNIKRELDNKTLSVEVMEALAHTIDAKDEYTRGHSVRVAKYSRLLAEKLGLNPEECENVYYMALLHDIGKIGVPNQIINSPTKLTDEQYDVIKRHPVVGYDILAEIKSRPDLSKGAKWHHERYDGKGYPDKKNGDEIPFYARVIAVADSYDAMTSNRSYRKYMPQDKVRSEIENNSGTQFDPDVAKCMLSIIDEDVNYELHE